LKGIFSTTNVHNFQVLGVEPMLKDGGAFVHFGYNPADGATPANALESISEAVKREIDKKGGIKPWFGVGLAHVDLVKGKPWKEVSRANLFARQSNGPLGS
jgi:hypothetical protein